jgi:transposase
LLDLLDQLDPKVEELDQAVLAEAESRPEVVYLIEHQKGVGPVVGLAFVLIVGPVERFRRSAQLVSYLGLNPSEHSSGGHQRLGAISKQGNTMMRWLLIEAAQVASQHDPELRRTYQRLKSRRGAKVAKVALARRLAVRLYWLLRKATTEASDNLHREASHDAPPVRTPGSSADPMGGASPSLV